MTGLTLDDAKTECPAGHPYDSENTRWSAGKRQCRECNREYDRRRYGARFPRKSPV